MLYSLSNEQLSIQVNTLGAELKSLKKGDREYIWQADPAIWPRSTPLLFPIVGRLKEHQYQYKGNTYTLAQHGFARDMEFRLFEKRADILGFSLNSNAQTLAMYPFSFQLTVFHQLVGDSLQSQFRIVNLGKEPMPASIGGHPGFNLPGKENYLEFEPETASLECELLQEGLRSGAQRSIPLHQNRLVLETNTFNQDALVIASPKFQKIRLAATDSEHGLDFSWEQASWFGIWAKPGAPFVCLEPWLGVTDGLDHNGELEAKAGILHIPPAGYAELIYQIKPW